MAFGVTSTPSRVQRRRTGTRQRSSAFRRGRYHARLGARTGGSATSTGPSYCAWAPPAPSARSRCDGAVPVVEAAAVPVTSTILLAKVLLRFSIRPPAVNDAPTTDSARFLSPLGLFGGFIDASGGGGWGPITTSTLPLARQDPHRAPSSVRLCRSSWCPPPRLHLRSRQRLLREQHPHHRWAGSRQHHRRTARRLAGRPGARSLLGTGVGGIIVAANAQKLFKTFDVTGVAATLGYLALGWGVGPVGSRRLASLASQRGRGRRRSAPRRRRDDTRIESGDPSLEPSTGEKA